MEFLSENPDVDVSAAWERCWGIQTKIIERVRARYDVKRHPSCDGREYFVSDDHEVHGKMEGSFNSYTGDEVDRKSTRLNSSHSQQSRMPSSA